MRKRFVIMLSGAILTLLAGCKKPTSDNFGSNNFGSNNLESNNLEFETGVVRIRINFVADVKTATVHGDAANPERKDVFHNQVLPFNANNACGEAAIFDYVSLGGRRYSRIILVQLHHNVVDIGPDGSIKLRQERR